MFQELTGFIERLDGEEHGNWVIDKENDGSPDHPIQMPYVNYGREAIAFEDAVYKFVDEHPEYDMKNYGEILEKAGIEWGQIRWKVPLWMILMPGLYWHS